MKLGRLAMKDLYDALLDAYPSRSALAQMVRFGLGENLDAITSSGSLASTAFELIQWAEARSQLDALLAAARAANEGNPRLRAFVERLASSHAAGAASAGSAPAGDASPGIHELHRAAMNAGLTQSRQALLAGLPATFVASLVSDPSPGAQMLLDLSALDVQLADGTDPLAVWLRNASLLAASRQESEVFRRALANRSAMTPAVGDTAPVAPVAPTAEPTGITPRAVRNLVNEILRGDSDLDALCLDFFPDVHARFSVGMDRVAKVNLLLQHAPPGQIVDALRESYPAKFKNLAASG